MCARIAIRIDEKDKTRWKDHVEEEPEYADLSDLIRTSVEHQIRIDKREEKGDEGPDFADELRFVLQTIEDMHDDLKSAQSKLDKINDEQATSKDVGKTIVAIRDIMEDSNDDN